MEISRKLRLTNKLLYYLAPAYRRQGGSLMNRRIPEKIDAMNFISAKLRVKLCETLRDMFFVNFLVTPLREEANNVRSLIE
jgi:hypothetical protein